MAKEKSDSTGTVKNIEWKELITRVEKNQGLSKKTVDESFKAVDTEIKSILELERPKKDGDLLVVKTPVTAIAQKFIPEHIEVDAKGNKFKVSATVGVTSLAPREYIKISNKGFELYKKKITADSKTE